MANGLGLVSRPVTIRTRTAVLACLALFGWAAGIVRLPAQLGVPARLIAGAIPVIVATVWIGGLLLRRPVVMWMAVGAMGSFVVLGIWIIEIGAWPLSSWRLCYLRCSPSARGVGLRIPDSPFLKSSVLSPGFPCHPLGNPLRERERTATLFAGHEGRPSRAHRVHEVCQLTLEGFFVRDADLAALDRPKLAAFTSPYRTSKSTKKMRAPLRN